MKILLIGNYAPDRQESMLRYAQLVDSVLANTSHEVRLVAPATRLDFRARGAVGLWKWAGYFDKLLLGPPALARAARWADLVHICDHSNAIYVPSKATRPYLVTCHDLLAVRGALGEHTDCPASAAGRYLQRIILAGLKRARAIVSCSEATRMDVARLVGSAEPVIPVIHPPLNYAFSILPVHETARRLAVVPELSDVPYVLIVGSGLRRKNRDCALRILSRIHRRWPGKFVFAGESLSAELRAYAVSLGVEKRVIDVPRPSGELLEALYNRALALLFPSRFEGFGWPLVEAQACGCPVVASDAPPHPEVTGGAAMLCSLARESDFDAAILMLAADATRRAALIVAGSHNAVSFGRDRFATSLIQVYESLV